MKTMYDMTVVKNLVILIILSIPTIALSQDLPFVDLTLS